MRNLKVSLTVSGFCFALHRRTAPATLPTSPPFLAPAAGAFSLQKRPQLFRHHVHVSSTHVSFSIYSKHLQDHAHPVFCDNKDLERCQFVYIARPPLHHGHKKLRDITPKTSRTVSGLITTRFPGPGSARNGIVNFAGPHGDSATKCVGMGLGIYCLPLDQSGHDRRLSLAYVRQPDSGHFRLYPRHSLLQNCRHLPSTTS